MAHLSMLTLETLTRFVRIPQLQLTHILNDVMVLLVFQKSSKKDQKKLKETDPDIYKEFENVWAVRNRHMVMGLPSQYVFFLRCCSKSECCHSFGQERKARRVTMLVVPPLIFSPSCTRYLLTMG